jgi:hypothetical protein
MYYAVLNSKHSAAFGWVGPRLKCPGGLVHIYDRGMSILLGHLSGLFDSFIKQSKS